MSFIWIRYLKCNIRTKTFFWHIVHTFTVGAHTFPRALVRHRRLAALGRRCRRGLEFTCKAASHKNLKTLLEYVNLCAECQFSSVSLLLCCVETTCMAIKSCVDYEYDATLLVVLWRPLVGFTASCCLVQGCSSWVLFCCWFFKRFEQTSAVFAFIRYLCWLQMSLSVVFLLFRSLTVLNFNKRTKKHFHVLVFVSFYIVLTWMEIWQFLKL